MAQRNGMGRRRSRYRHFQCASQRARDAMGERVSRRFGRNIAPVSESLWVKPAHEG
jgi:hypothetical protein